MSCSHCMEYKPKFTINSHAQFICFECGEIWVLAGVGPGNYWEPLEKHKQEEERVKQIIAKHINQDGYNNG